MARALACAGRKIRFVFLDRDGVINRKAPEGEYIGSPEQLHLLPGAAQAIADLNASGATVIIVTNQRGIALGKYTEADLDRVHARLASELAKFGAHIDRIYFCPHDKHECDCRKPGTKLFRDAFADFPGANSWNSVLIGDSLSDIQAGNALGIHTLFVRGDVATRKPGAEEAEKLAGAAFDSLAEAVEALVTIEL